MLFDFLGYFVAGCLGFFCLFVFFGGEGVGGGVGRFAFFAVVVIVVVFVFNQVTVVYILKKLNQIKGKNEQ